MTDDLKSYLESAPHPSVLHAIIDAVREALPEATPVKSYEILAFRHGGRNVIYAATWKAHFALYPTSPAIIEAVVASGVPHKIKGRSLHFFYTNPFPKRLIGDLARLATVPVRPPP